MKRAAILVLSTALTTSVALASADSDVQCHTEGVSGFGSPLVSYKFPFVPELQWRVGQLFCSSTESHRANSGLRYAIDLNYGGCNDDRGYPVLAMAAGTVIQAKCDEDEPMSAHSGVGCMVVLSHAHNGTPDVERSRYMHMTTFTVHAGDTVDQGQQIGVVGNTGKTWTAEVGDYCAHIHVDVQRVVPTASQGILPVKFLPLDGQNALNVGTSYTSTNSNAAHQYSLIGYTSSDVRSGFVGPAADLSLRVAEAHRRSAVRWFKLSLYPKADDGQPPALSYVHPWGGVQLQNFNDNDFELRGAIIGRPNPVEAFAVRAGFWQKYRTEDGQAKFGSPTTDEGCWVDETNRFALGLHHLFLAAQLFSKDKIMLWDPTWPGATVRDFSSAGIGVIRLTPCFSVGAAGFTGSDETTFRVQVQSVAYDHVVLSAINEPGIVYDTIRLYRNGLAAADYPGTTASITDNGVAANTTYEYQLEGRSNNWGSVSVTDPLSVTTPPNPNTLDLAVSARDARIVDVTIYDTLFNALVHGIRRNGQTIARTSGREFSDFDVVPQTTYSYQVEALNGQNESLGLSPVRTVTTPADTEPPPPPPPPPQDPVYPIRLVSGVTLISPAPPAVVLKDSCVTVEFTLENVGTVAVSLDSFIAVAYVDMIFQQTIRNFGRDQFQPAITLQPGDQYTYRRDNCNNVFPGVFAHAVVKPYFKVHTVAGDRLITDLGTNTGYLSFDILESNLNPDFVVTALSITPPQPAAGDAVSATFVVANHGDGLAPTSNFRLTLDDGTVRTSSLPQINAGASTTTTFDLGTQAEGTYHLAYWIDPVNLVHEWNETNNTGGFYYRVGDDPHNCRDASLCTNDLYDVAQGCVHLPNGLCGNAGFADNFNRADDNVLDNSWAESGDSRGSCIATAGNELAIAGGSGSDCGAPVATRDHGDLSLGAGETASMTFKVRLPSVNRTAYAGLYALPDGSNLTGIGINQNPQVHLRCNGALTVSSNYAMSPDTDYYIWLEYSPNGLAAHVKAYISTSSTKPAFPVLEKFDCAYTPQNHHTVVSVDSPLGGTWHFDDVWVSTTEPATLDADSDGVSDQIDNCLLIPNQSQSNADVDEHGDACDNCPTVPNSDRADLDADGFGDVCDCAPSNASLPVACNDANPCTDDSCGPAGCSHVNNSLGCNDGSDCTSGDACTNGACVGIPGSLPQETDAGLRVDQLSGVPTIHWQAVPEPVNVYRGARRPGRAFEYNGGCLAESVTSTNATDTLIPPAGGLFYYLVSRENVCGESILGRDGTGAAVPNAHPCPSLGGDRDADSVPDQLDDCPDMPDVAQADGDQDSYGNACDNCPSVSNPTQQDSDHNGVGDACQCACAVDETCNTASGQCNAPLLPIPSGDVWSYFRGFAEPSPPPAPSLTSWASVGFNDAAWLRAPGGFGYGGDCLSQRGTTLGDMFGGYLSVYLRHRFRVDNPSQITTLRLTVDFDDGFVAYINGVEVARANVAGTPPAYSTPAGTAHLECSVCDTPPCFPASVFDINVQGTNLLVPGSNVLAIQGHNVSISSSTDFSLIPSLAVP